MFEIYAIIATILLPTGLFTLIYFLYNSEKGKKSSMLWILIFESLATVSLGVFYMYGAIVLSQTSVSSLVPFVNSHIDDLAIINDTAYSDADEPSFEMEPIPADHTNEIEDTRNNKNQPTISQFLQQYQNLVQSAVRKKLQNGSSEHRALYQRMLQYARNLKQLTMTTVENENCFLRTFFYQALLAYSFISCAISLFNACQFCKQCSSEEPIPPVQGTQPGKNPSETFGEKINDNDSDNSSQNSAPIGPFFETDSIGSSTPNLEVFSVKKTSKVNLTAAIDRPSSRQTSRLSEENKGVTAAKCLGMFALPLVLVGILYLIMSSAYDQRRTPLEKINFDFLPNFNTTSPDIQTANFIKTSLSGETFNASHQQEIQSILNGVYAIINKFQENQKHSSNLPTVKGQYFYSLSPPSNKNTTNTTETCFTDSTSLKTFDFVLFVSSFFAVILYSKLNEVKMSKAVSTQTLTKCIWAFVMLWTPSILDTVVSIFLMDRGPNIVSSLLLLIGNMDRLYSTVQNVSSYKRYGTNGGFVKPTSK